MPTASAAPTFRPATNRQTAFIRSLIAERSAETLAPFGEEIARFVTYGSIRRDLIDRLLETPRASSNERPEATPEAGAEDMLAPSTSLRAGRMLRAGSIEATATMSDGRHVTVTIRTRARSGRGYTNAALGDDGSRTSIKILGSTVGWINRHGDQYRLTLRTRRQEYRDAVRAVLAYAAGVPITGNVDHATVYRVQEAARCGRCFRTLTDPVSIDRGVGPECYGRDTGSEHVPSVEAVAERSSRRAAQHATEPVAAESTSVGRELRAAREAAEERRQAHLRSLRASAPGSVDRARDLIAEALDAYCDDADRDFAMNIFDQLATR
jgi:hypothetical protein